MINDLFIILYLTWVLDIGNSHDLYFFILLNNKIVVICRYCIVDVIIKYFNIKVFNTNIITFLKLTWVRNIASWKETYLFLLWIIGNRFQFWKFFIRAFSAPPLNFFFCWCILVKKNNNNSDIIKSDVRNVWFYNQWSYHITKVNNQVIDVLRSLKTKYYEIWVYDLFDLGMWQTDHHHNSLLLLLF